MLAMYEERAQEEVWGADPEALIASGIAFPQGRAKKAEGGYVISGKWKFLELLEHREWTCSRHGARRRSARRLPHVPAAQVAVRGHRRLAGARDARDGSMTVVAKDVFVPSTRRFACWMRAAATDFPARRAIPTRPTACRSRRSAGTESAPARSANAQGALELAIAAVKERSTNYTGAKMRDFQAVQLRVARAGSEDRRRAPRAAQRLSRGAGNREPPGDRGCADEAALQAHLAYAVGLATEAVDMLHAMAGANGIYQAAPLERIFRDAHSLAGHISFSFDAQPRAGASPRSAAKSTTRRSDRKSRRPRLPQFSSPARASAAGTETRSPRR